MSHTLSLLKNASLPEDVKIGLHQLYEVVGDGAIFREAVGHAFQAQAEQFAREAGLSFEEDPRLKEIMDTYETKMTELAYEMEQKVNERVKEAKQAAWALDPEFDQAHAERIHATLAAQTE